MQTQEMEVNEFIHANFSIIAKLSNCGLLPSNVIPDYEIYSFYENLENVKSKMDKYTITATEKGVSEGKVRKVVRYMEKNI